MAKIVSQIVYNYNLQKISTIQETSFISNEEHSLKQSKKTTNVWQ